MEAPVAAIARTRRIAIVSIIDGDLLARISLPVGIDLVCTTERARGCKPDDTLFRYVIDHAGVPLADILHAWIALLAVLRERLLQTQRP